jgi:uncharacterized damage-inducible protein DinB
MLLRAIGDLYAYGDEATRRLLQTSDGLTAAEWELPAEPRQVSIQGTLLHVLETQRRWLNWWSGASTDWRSALLMARLDPAMFPDGASLLPVCDAMAADQMTFLRALSESDLERVYISRLNDGTEIRPVLWQMMLHVANHGTQHRSQAASMLTAHGRSPGDLDLGFYFDRRRQDG